MNIKQMFVKDMIEIGGENNRVFFQYVKKSRRKPPIGVVAGILLDNEILVGWSLCRKGDVFHREIGRTIAVGRAINGSSKKLNVAQSCQKIVNKMHDRLVEIHARHRDVR